MNFLSMQYFSMVAREKSFTKAAAKLYITQQTLSAHIAAIEKELGCQLIIRRVPLELTYAGQIFLKYAVDIQKKYENMEYEFKDIVQEDKGKLRIGIGHTRGRAIMPKLIMAFQKIYPKIEIELVEDLNDVLRQKLIDGEIDIAIAKFDEKDPEIISENFYNEEIVLLIADKLLDDLYKDKKNEVITRLENQDIYVLNNCPFLLNSQRDIFGKVGHGILTQGNFIPKIKVISSNTGTLLALCTYGAGACFCTENLLNASLTSEQRSLLRLFRFGEDAKYTICFKYLKNSYQWSMISNFIKLSKELINKQL